MVSEIVRGASISKLYVPAYEDYVVGEQSLEWRWNCGMNKKDCHYEIILGTRYEFTNMKYFMYPHKITRLNSLNIYLT